MRLATKEDIVKGMVLMNTLTKGYTSILEQVTPTGFMVANEDQPGCNTYFSISDAKNFMVVSSGVKTFFANLDHGENEGRLWRRHEAGHIDIHKYNRICKMYDEVFESRRENS